MNQVRMALIGFGTMGSKYAAMIRDGQVPGMVLAGVCCRNQAGQQILCTDYPGVAIYQDVADTLAHAKDYDAALIVTPHTTHVEIARQMVAAGKHILLDKPAGIDAGGVADLVRQADEAGLTFGMIFNNRTNPAFLKAKELLDQGIIGQPVRGIWVCNTWYRTPCYHHSAPWRSSWAGERGGLLINQCQHYLDLWIWLLGLPDAILASLEYGRYNDFAVDDAADLQFFYDNGLHGTFISSSGETPGVNRLEIWGSRGRLCVEGTAWVTLDLNEMSTEEFAVANQIPFAPLPHHLEEVPITPNPEPYQTVLRRFADHLRNGTPMVADGQDGLRAVQLTNAAYLSSWTQRKLRLPVNNARFLQGLEQKIREEQHS